MVKHRSPKPRFRVRVAADPQNDLFLPLLMLGVGAAMTAKFRQLDFARDELFVFAAPVISALALAASQFD